MDKLIYFHSLLSTKETHSTHHNAVIVIILRQTALSAGAAGADAQIAEIVGLILVVNGQGSQFDASSRTAAFSSVL